MAPTNRRHDREAPRGVRAGGGGGHQVVRASVSRRGAAGERNGHCAPGLACRVDGKVLDSKVEPLTAPGALTRPQGPA